MPESPFCKAPSTPWAAAWSKWAAKPIRTPAPLPVFSASSVWFVPLLPSAAEILLREHKAAEKLRVAILLATSRSNHRSTNQSRLARRCCRFPVRVDDAISAKVQEPAAWHDRAQRWALRAEHRTVHASL